MSTRWVGKFTRSMKKRRETLVESLPELFEIFEELIKQGAVTLTLDSRCESTVVPPQYLGDLCINLKFCHEFEIADFEYDEYGVRASLRFGQQDHFCDVPWASVYVMVGGGDYGIAVFPSHVPVEMRDELSEFIDGLDGQPVRVDALGDPDLFDALQ